MRDARARPSLGGLVERRGGGAQRGADLALAVGARPERGLEGAGREVDAATDHPRAESPPASDVARLRAREILDRGRAEEVAPHGAGLRELQRDAALGGE